GRRSKAGAGRSFPPGRNRAHRVVHRRRGADAGDRLFLSGTATEVAGCAMKGLLTAVLVFAACAVAAQAPSDFRSSASITPRAGSPLQRFTLPFEAYRDARADLADVRIF